MRKSIFWAAALVAIVASMIGAAAAQGAVFKAAQEEAFVSVLQPEPNSLTLGFESGLTVNCESVLFAGLIKGATSAVNVSPGFGGCTAFGSPEGSIEAGLCEFIFHPGSGSGDEFTGTLDIACPPGEAITVIGGNCEVQIGSQSGLGPVGYDEVTPENPEKLKEAKATFEMSSASGFAYTKTLDGASCPLSGTGMKTDGVFGGAMNMQAGEIGTFQQIDFGIE